MSESESTEMESTEEPPLPVKVIRSVSPGYGPRPNPEMNGLGWMMFLGIAVLLLPFLPIIALVWLISKVLDAAASAND